MSAVSAISGKKYFVPSPLPWHSLILITQFAKISRFIENHMRSRHCLQYHGQKTYLGITKIFSNSLNKNKKRPNAVTYTFSSVFFSYYISGSCKTKGLIIILTVSKVASCVMYLAFTFYIWDRKIMLQLLSPLHSLRLRTKNGWSSKRTGDMEFKVWFHSGFDGVFYRPWKCLAVSLSVLQKWWRWGFLLCSQFHFAFPYQTNSVVPP